MGSNRGYIISGTKWLSASSIISALTYMLTLSILARFLAKSDFGILAILTFMQGLIQMLSSLGFSSAIMHKQGLSKDEFCSLFWIQMFVYIAIYVLTILLSPFIADYYNEPQLTELIPLFLLSLPLLGIGSLYGTILHKNFEYRTIAFRDIISSICSLVVAVILAYWGMGVYSLVIFMLLRIAIVQIWNFVKGVSVIVPSFIISMKQVKPLISIGLYQTGSNVIDYLGSSLDVLIIGKYLGTDVLGGYNLAKELVSKGLYLLNSIGNKVVLPVYSSLQENKDSLGDLYCKHITIVASLCFPICILLGGLSGDIIRLFYGTAYLDMSNVLVLLSLWGLLAAIGNPISGIVTATGRTDLAFIYTSIRIIIVIPLIYIAAQFNIETVAIAVIIGEFISFFLSWYLELYKTIKLGLIVFAKSFASLMIVSLLLIALGQSFSLFGIIPILNFTLRLITGSTVLIALFCVLYAFVQRRMFLYFLNASKARLNSYFSH